MVPNASIPFSVSGSNNTLSASSSLTSNSSGVATTALSTTTAQTKTISIDAPSTAAGASGTVTFASAAAIASLLEFSIQPSTLGTAGTALSTQPVVKILDSNGADTTSTATVTLTAYTGSNCTGAASGTLSNNSVSASGGVATFSGLSHSAAETIYLKATSNGLTSACTTAGTVVSSGLPAKLAFFVQPTDVTAGSSISPSIKIQVLDSNNALVSTATNSVTLAIGTNSGSGTLSGTLTASASAGVATFAGISINKIGSGYTLTATSSGLSSATSGTFNVTAGAASKIVFKSTSPASVVVGACTSSAYTIESQERTATPRQSGQQSTWTCQKMDPEPQLFTLLPVAAEAR